VTNLGDTEREKRAAAEAAAALVHEGSTVGLGTGTTVSYLLPALAKRRLDLRCVATSPATEEKARELGLRVEPFDRLDRLDMAIDGADQIDPSGWLVKGGGGAHTREKIVAGAAERLVVIASSDKLVEALSPPVPLELLPYGCRATLRMLAPVALRGLPPSPDGGLIADYLGPIETPAELAARLAGVPGVVEHGLFSPDLVTEVLVGRGSEVHRFAPGSGRRHCK
jgi:ribose 5-phosphate isomerase A